MRAVSTREPAGDEGSFRKTHPISWWAALRRRHRKRALLSPFQDCPPTPSTDAGSAADERARQRRARRAPRKLARHWQRGSMCQEGATRNEHLERSPIPTRDRRSASLCKAGWLVSLVANAAGLQPIQIEEGEQDPARPGREASRPRRPSPAARRPRPNRLSSPTAAAPRTARPAASASRRSSLHVE